MNINLDEFKNMDLNTLYEYTKSEIEYGWVDDDGKKHFCTNDDDLQYHLQSPEETLERKIAICWDKAELLRYYFESNNYEVHTYFVYLYITDEYCPSHTVVTYKKDNKYIWFEPSIPINLSGIREYANETELVEDIERCFLANGFLNDFFNKDNDLNKLVCYEYLKPKFGIRGSEFYEHCRSGRKII